MNYIDYIIIILLVITAIKGAVKGLIYEVTSLIALIGGVWGAIKFSAATQIFMVERFNFTNKHIDIIAFVITFVFIIILVHIVGKAVEKALESVSLGPANRILGFLFAVFKTAFILGIIMILIEKIDESLPIIPEDDVKESRLYEPLHAVAVNSFPFLKGLYEDIRGKDKESDEDESDDDNKSDDLI